MVFAAVMWLFQLFLSFFVFSDREFSITSITVDNRCNNAQNYNVNKEFKHLTFWSHERQPEMSCFPV